MSLHNITQHNLLYWLLWCTLGANRIMNHFIWTSNSSKELCFITTAVLSAFLEKKRRLYSFQSQWEKRLPCILYTVCLPPLNNFQIISASHLLGSLGCHRQKDTFKSSDWTLQAHALTTAAPKTGLNLTNSLPDDHISTCRTYFLNVFSAVKN